MHCFTSHVRIRHRRTNQLCSFSMAWEFCRMWKNMKKKNVEICMYYRRTHRQVVGWKLSKWKKSHFHISCYWFDAVHIQIGQPKQPLMECILSDESHFPVNFIEALINKIFSQQIIFNTYRIVYVCTLKYCNEALGTASHCASVG